VGSGNIGATNAWRAGGRAVGLLTLLLDAAKAAGPAGAALLLAPPGDGTVASLAAATGAVVGHCFSLFLRFTGGKGVATILGALAVVGWPWGLAAFAVAFAVAALVSRTVSVASLCACWAAPLAVAAGQRDGPTAAALAACAALVTWRHRTNLERLARGEEPRLFEGGAS
jgi:glycerol-3-phosphate acyltransferase PlsY